ncbi:hypothetical protein LSAT2_022069 [Lamellibrachia satsuma]|nr:hypothetical protein LSAT2_022069 [Lamellibrachia satsuma]
MHGDKWEMSHSVGEDVNPTIYGSGCYWVCRSVCLHVCQHFRILSKDDTPQIAYNVCAEAVYVTDHFKGQGRRPRYTVESEHHCRWERTDHEST